MFKSGLQISPIDPKQDESYFKIFGHLKNKFHGFGNLHGWGNLFFSNLPEKYFYADSKNDQPIYAEHTEDRGV